MQRNMTELEVSCDRCGVPAVATRLIYHHHGALTAEGVCVQCRHPFARHYDVFALTFADAAEAVSERVDS